MLNGKAMIVYLIVGLTKRYCYIKTSNIQPYIFSKNNMEVKLDSTNHATKYDLNTQ